jgi:hypothetical protein
MPLIRIETRIAAPAAVCFDLMRDASVHTRSVAQTGERAVAGRTSGPAMKSLGRRGTLA